MGAEGSPRVVGDIGVVAGCGADFDPLSEVDREQ
jgi:hypothetical protein